MTGSYSDTLKFGQKCMLMGPTIVKGIPYLRQISRAMSLLNKEPALNSRFFACLLEVPFCSFFVVLKLFVLVPVNKIERERERTHNWGTGQAG